MYGSVPEAGLEPARPFGQILLRNPRQPIAPLGLNTREDSEVRSPQEVALVRVLADQGLNHCEIARHMGIPRGTVRGWLTARAPQLRPAQGGLSGLCRATT